MTPAEELSSCIGALELMVNQAKVLQAENKLMPLCNLLNRIERVAREGTYVIFDIADLVG